MFDDSLSSQAQQYHSAIINSVRTEVDKWPGRGRREVYQMQDDRAKEVEAAFNKMIGSIVNEN